MIGGVTRHVLPHLSGVPHLQVNRPQGYIYTLLDPFLCRHEKLSCILWTATVHGWSKSFTHIKHRFGALNTNLHFRLSRVPVVTSTHLLPLRFEYLFTLQRRGTETLACVAWRFCRAGRTSGEAAGREIRAQSGFSALARLYYVARPTKTAMLRRLQKHIRHMTIHFKIAAVQRCSVTKLEPKSLLSCVITWFFVSAQELSGIVWTQPQ